MRVYMINADDLIVSREPPAEPGENEIAVTSLDELRAARLSGKRLLALWNGLPGAERLSKIGDREALVDRACGRHWRLYPIRSRGGPRSKPR